MIDRPKLVNRRILHSGVALSLLLFLTASTPHRVHHFFDQSSSTAVSRAARTHEHADGTHHSHDHNKNRPKSTQSDCVVLSVAQHAHASVVQIFSFTVVARAMARHDEQVVFAAHSINLAPDHRLPLVDSSIDGNRSKGEGGAPFRRTHNIDGSSPSRPKRKADAKTIRKGGESDLRRSALRAGRKIEGVCGQNNLFVAARHGTRDNGKAENLNHRGMDVLRHRVTITYEAEAEEKTSETIIQKIFDELPVP